jgi:GxxExxY protein
MNGKKKSSRWQWIARSLFTGSWVLVSRNGSTKRRTASNSTHEAFGFEREQKIKVRYKAWSIPGQRIDLVVESLVIVEIKAVSKLARVHERQVRSYLKTMGLRAGLLVNFNVAMVKNGIKRVVQTWHLPKR